MSNLIASDKLVVVIGMGATGLSVARFLKRRQQAFIMLDTRTEPENLATFVGEFADVAYELGPLSQEILLSADEVVVSPGVALSEPALQAAAQAGIKISGDVQLFADNVEAPIVAITGSNAKSTVTTLVGEMAKRCGKNVGVGGNLGTPVLDMLGDRQERELFVLELSSFQLETTTNLSAQVAAVLNISEDHMDRYPNMQAYHAAKHRIFRGAKVVVVNRDDALTQPLLGESVERVSFGLDQPDLNQFGLREENQRLFLSHGLHTLMPVDELKMQGRHNVGNALAALAMGHAIGFSMVEMLNVLRDFSGLSHRCESVATIAGIDFVNDSKGTNVGATLAALDGLSRLPNKIVLIAGGDGKGADFEPLREAISSNVRALIAIGTDGDKIANLAKTAGSEVGYAESMVEAVSKAFSAAKSGDLVLLSPACASLDMFANFADRGDQFVAAVKGLRQ